MIERCSNQRWLDQNKQQPTPTLIYLQAATLCFGLIKDHPWVGGNKRTATHLTDHFLRINGWEIIATPAAVVQMVLSVESEQTDLVTLTQWMTEHIRVLN